MGMNLKKSIVLVIIVMVVPSIPAIVFALLGWGAATEVWILGTMTGVLAVVSSSVRLSIPTVVSLGIASALAVLNQGNPWGSMIIMGACAFIEGLVSVRGLTSSVSMFAISVAFFVAQPPVISTSLSTPQEALIIGFIAMCAGLWGLLLSGTVFRKVRFPRGRRLVPKYSTVMAIVLGVLVGGTAWVVADRNLGHGGAWLMMTILIVAQPGITTTFHRGVQRAIGTVAGFVIAILLSPFINQPVPMLIVGLALIGAALLVKMDPKNAYWKFVFFLTPGVVLIVGSSGDDGSLLNLAFSRLGYTILGSLLGLAAVALLFPFYRNSNSQSETVSANSA